MKRSVDLATRHVGSIEVTLIWDRLNGSLAVSAQDGMTGEDLLLPVSADEAAERSQLVPGDGDQNGLFRSPGRSSHVAVPVAPGCRVAHSAGPFSHEWAVASRRTHGPPEDFLDWRSCESCRLSAKTRQRRKTGRGVPASISPRPSTSDYPAALGTNNRLAWRRWPRSMQAGVTRVLRISSASS
jgi:hypothetical protein